MPRFPRATAAAASARSMAVSTSPRRQAASRSRLAEPDRVSRYAFGHKTATFLICSRCGVEAAAVCEMEGRLYAVLNANLLSPPLAVDRASVPIADYEAEDVPGRLDRRKQRWISNVTIVEG